MYVVTYYSYKGGVGRTMALINTAVSFALSGRRVLIVDFDLEAPGLPTFRPFNCATEMPGLIDYVGQYLAENAAPDARGFVSECRVPAVPELAPAGATIHLMSAGRPGADYGERLNVIDWQRLYSERSGYLMFEDLKNQWRSMGFDYVFVDSRTGHTDVAGICTRQLPDAVVVLFLPNAQNISGLKPIVQTIRHQKRPEGREQIKLHFCPSNVPDLDDEYEILHRRLDEAQRELGYAEAASVIHHYSSLDLLDQKIFIAERPRTKLAHEYRNLQKAIAAENLEDREGALAALAKLQGKGRNLRQDDRSQLYAEMRDVARRIEEHHANDPEIAFQLGLIYLALGRLEDQVAAFTTAAKGEGHREESLRRRADALVKLGRREEADADLISLISSVEVPANDFMAAVQLLRSLRPKEWVGLVLNAPALDQLGAPAKVDLAEQFTGSTEGLPKAKSLMKSVLDDPSISASVKQLAENVYVRVCIALHDYREAVRHISENESDLSRIDHLFNYAIADWGLRRVPDLSLFERVVEKAKSDRAIAGPNYNQCLAIALFVIGDRQEAQRRVDNAFEQLKQSGHHASAWTYLTVPAKTFREHLLEMAKQGEADEIRPPVIYGRSPITRSIGPDN